MVTVIAHRGARSLAPENTLAAARKAHGLGADLWETDVAVTADDQLVLMHDDAMTRTTNVSDIFPERVPAAFSTYSLAEIRSLGVSTSHHGGGVGSKLVEHFMLRATRLHIPRVFVLTRTPKFFGRLGFCQQEMESMPEKVFKDCVNCPKIDCCDEIPMVYETNV